LTKIEGSALADLIHEGKEPCHLRDDTGHMSVSMCACVGATSVSTLGLCWFWFPTSSPASDCCWQHDRSVFMRSSIHGVTNHQNTDAQEYAEYSTNASRYNVSGFEMSSYIPAYMAHTHTHTLREEIK